MSPGLSEFERCCACHTRWALCSELICDYCKTRRRRSARISAARRKGKHTSEAWQALLAEIPFCVRCGRDDAGLTRDHIVPISCGGSDAIENIQPMCPSCNAWKGTQSLDFISARREEARR